MNASRSSIRRDTTVSATISCPSSSAWGCTSTSRTSGGSVASIRLNSVVQENVRWAIS